MSCTRTVTWVTWPSARGSRRKHAGLSGRREKGAVPLVALDVHMVVLAFLSASIGSPERDLCERGPVFPISKKLRIPAAVRFLRCLTNPPLPPPDTTAQHVTKVVLLLL